MMSARGRRKQKSDGEEKRGVREERYIKVLQVTFSTPLIRFASSPFLFFAFV